MEVNISDNRRWT